LLSRITGAFPLCACARSIGGKSGLCGFFSLQNFSKMQYHGKIYGKLAGKYIELETWKPASVLPKENKDVIAVMSDGTYFMARYSSVSGWGFYFLDNGLQFDDSIGRKVTHWLPLTALPSIPA
jgi:hypothetical protein